MAGFSTLSPGANPGGGPTVNSSVSSPFGMPSPSGGAGHAMLGGKASKQQNMGSPHAGVRSTLTAGAPSSRAMGQYGKGHGGLGQIRGGSGQMRRIRGGLGAGKLGTASPSPANGMYGVTNFDTE